MKAQKYTREGKVLGEIELPSGLFDKEISMGAVYDAIKSENSNLRAGTHSTKTRGEVSGGGKKPWAQKGTGRARQGSTRAPHWVGGGTVQGPKPKDYSSKLSRNVKRKAVVSILNKKAQEKRISVLEDIALNSYSTKQFASIMKNMGISKTGAIGFVTSGEDKHLRVSVRNIPNVKYINVKRIVCRDMLYNNNLVITESALADLANHYKDVV